MRPGRVHQDSAALASRRDPHEPAEWLKTTARNRTLDQLRRAITGAAKLQEVAMSTFADAENDWADGAVADDRMRLMFACATGRCPSTPRWR
jgi:RNA polymerase sigma-70 factor, ECF subfamily